ncbi:MAG: hypothetical protein Q9165_004795 [Trypethelium subeluteriae]
MSNYLPVPTYFSYPKDKGSNTHAVLILTDVIGHEATNAQLYDSNSVSFKSDVSLTSHSIADQFAANGYFCVMPDLFEGDPVPLNRPESFDIGTWRQGHGNERVDPIVEATIKEMRSNLGVKKIGAVGYCFGAKYVFRFLKDGLIDAGFVAHPSFVDAEEVKSITGPISIAAAETDQIFPAPKRRETEDMLKDMSVPYQLSLYSGTSHGFAVRADLSQPQIKWAKEQAFYQAVQWFDEHVKS